MKKPMKLWLSGLLALSLIPLSLAVSAAAAPAPCAGTAVTGTVVAVDAATRQVTLDTGAGDLCTVLLPAAETRHPIVSLLGRYFDQASLTDLTAALETTAVWVVCPAAGPCTLAAADTTGAVAGRVTGVTANADGTYTLTVQPTAGGAALSVPAVSPTLAEPLSAALAELAVHWDLAEGAVVQEAASAIAALHQDGLGFGVIVKLYAMAEASQAACAAQPAPAADCGVTVAELIEEFRSGVGLGQLFKLYGKPTLLGVGHVRRAGPPATDTVPGWPGAEAADEAADQPGAPATNHPGCVNGGSGANAHNPHCTGGAPGNNGNGNNGNGNNGNNGNGHGKP